MGLLGILFLVSYWFLLSNGALLEGHRIHSLQAVVPSQQPYRTAYHFQSPKNWLNDPNGPMYYKGVYHLFYQYNPSGALFGEKMIWAHSASYDLINWFSLDPALTPSEPFDINSCWSGSVTILPGNKPVILYTGIDANKTQVQNLATPKNLSDPFLVQWVKYAKNPVMTPPEGVKADEFRDPTTAWKGLDGKWRVIVGSLEEAILYQSDDFYHWYKAQDALYTAGETGMWECPDFYPVSVNGTNGVDTSVQNPSVRHVMKAGFNLHDYYVLGTYVPETEMFLPYMNFTGSTLDLRYDYGKFYASKTFFDSAKNRRVLWGWVNESDSSEDDIEKGWSGLQSIPRQIWLDTSGKRLVQWPVEEINSLRYNLVSKRDFQLENRSVLEISGITAAQADIEIVFKLPELEEVQFINSTQIDPQEICTKESASANDKFGPFGLLALATKNLEEQTAVFFRVFQRNEGYVLLMCSDQSRSSLRNEIDKQTYGTFLDIDLHQDKISLRTLIDHSIIESFGGEGKACITTRVYPKLAIDKEAHLYVFNNGTQGVEIVKMNAWSVKKAQINTRGSLE